MIKKSSILLAVVALWACGSLYLITLGMSFEQVAEDFQHVFKKLGDALSALRPSFSWNVGWLTGLAIVAIPGILGVILDGRGQAASGWLALAGLGISCVALLIFLPVYLGGTVLAIIWNFFGG